MDIRVETVTDPDYPGSKIYEVTALTVGTTRNGNKYTKEELEKAARGLSFRTININHEQSKRLSYPENQTLAMDFIENAVRGQIRIADPQIQKMIESGDINKLSIEQIPVDSEDCDEKACLQKGVTFTEIALLTKDTPPGDPNTEIKLEMLVRENSSSNGNTSQIEEISQNDKMAEETPKTNSLTEEQAQLLRSVLKASGKEDLEECVAAAMAAGKTPEEAIASCQKPESDCGCDKSEDAPVPTAAPAVETTEAKPVELSAAAMETLKSSEQKQLEKLEELIGLVKPKEEAVKPEPSSKVADVKTEAYKPVHEFFEGVKSGSISENSTSWEVDLDKMYEQWGYKHEAVTVSSGTPAQQYSKSIMIIPGGKSKVPIRQFCDFVKLSGQEKANWYKLPGFSFGAITEGTEPTNVSQTLAKITATPSIRGAVQRIGYSQIEDVPGLTNSVNAHMALEAASDEEKLLHAAFDAETPTNWINANTGGTISSDDVASMTFKREAIVASKKKLSEQGYDISPGSLVAILHPKAYSELLLDTNLNNYYQDAQSSITATGALEKIYGVDIVVSANVTAQDNSTNDTYRNIIFAKGDTFGLAATRNLSVEAQRRNEVQQVVVSGTHRVACAVKDEASCVRISSAQ